MPSLRPAIALAFASACSSPAGVDVDAAVTDAAVGDAAVGDAATDGAPDAAIDAPAAAGTVIWRRLLGGDNVVVGDVAIGDDGAIYVTLASYYPVDLGGGHIGEISTDNLYLAKYSIDGVHAWSKRFAVGGLERPSLAAAPGGGVYLAVATEGAADVGRGPLPAVGRQDLLVAHIDAGGEAVAARRLGGPITKVVVLDVAADPAGNVHVVGTLDHATDPQGTGTLELGTTTLSGRGARDGWVASFDGDLTTRWGRPIGAPTYPYGTEANAVAIDPASGDVVVCGGFNGTVDLGGGARTVTGGAFGYDVFVLTVTGANGYVGDRVLDGGTCARVAVDADGRRWLGGEFGTSIAHDGVSHPGPGSANGFVTRIAGAEVRMMTFGAPSTIGRVNDIAADGWWVGGIGGGADLMLGTTAIHARPGTGLVGQLGDDLGHRWAQPTTPQGSAGLYALAPTADGVIVLGYHTGTLAFGSPPIEGTGPLLARLARQ